MKIQILIILTFFTNLALLPATPSKIHIPAEIDLGIIYSNTEFEIKIPISNSSGSPAKISMIGSYATMDVVGPVYRSVNLEPYSHGEILYKFRPTHNIDYKIFLYYMVEHAGSVYVSSTVCNAEVKHLPEGIYDFSNNLWEKDLLNALSTYLKNHKSFTYREARELLWTSFDNYDKIVECVYTGKTVLIDGIPDFAELDKNGFNTEHTWPRSYGSDTEPPLSDMYHIFPCDKTANDKRANFPYGYVTGNVSWQNGGSKLGLDQNGKVVFEPREIFKGHLARAILYFAVRYDNPFKFLDSQENVLREWALLYPPDELEKRRNDSIAAYQLKRNVFIDHPEFLDRINSISGDANFSDNKDAIQIGEHIEYRININNMTDSFPVGFYIYNAGLNDYTLKQFKLDFQSNLKGFIDIGSDSEFIFPNKRKGHYAREITITKPETLLYEQDSIHVSVTTTDGEQFRWLILLFDDPTSISEPKSSNNSHITIFPNPSKEIIQLETNFPTEQITGMTISNMEGKIIDERYYQMFYPSSNNIVLNINKLKQFGNVFIIRIVGKDFEVVNKFIISE